MEDLLQGSSCIFQRTSLDAVRSADENERVRALVSKAGFSFQALGPRADVLDLSEPPFSCL